MLHPDERQWAEKNAMEFASVYKEKTGQDLTPEQAQNMLLANGYRLVDAAASKGPGGDAVAVAYISQNVGNLFSATSAEYNSPFLFGMPGNSLTPEQIALGGKSSSSTAALSMGVNAQGHLFSVGGSAEVGVTLGFGDKPNLCVYAQACGTYGLGFYAGAGVSATVSQGAPSSGSSVAKGGFLAGGAGPIADVTITQDTTSGNIAAGKGVIGIGAGVAAVALSASNKVVVLRGINGI
jgi:filamentous hemagglutinin